MEAQALLHPKEALLDVQRKGCVKELHLSERLDLQTWKLFPKVDLG